MIICALFGMLAAFGLVCGVWTLCGFFLKPDEGVLRYRGNDPVEFARRYLWLREMRLITCKLAVEDPPEDWIPWLKDQGIEVICGDDPPLDRREKA